MKQTKTRSKTQKKNQVVIFNKTTKGGARRSMPAVALDFEYLKNRRLELGLPAIALCEKMKDLGVNFHHVCLYRIESGAKQNIVFSTFLALLKVLSIDIEQAIKPNPESNEAFVANYYEVSPIPPKTEPKNSTNTEGSNNKKIKKESAM